MDIKVKSEFKQLIPPLTKAEYDGLETSIVNEGCRDAILVWQQDEEKVIIDGHNRYEICQRHNIPFETKNISFESENDAEVWVIRNQFNRRNLSTYQRSVLALQLEDMFRERGRAKQVSAGGPLPQKSVEAPIDTQKELAKIAGVSHDTIMRVKKIEEVSPFFVKEMLSIGDMSINEAYKEIKRKERNEGKHFEIKPIPEGEYDIVYCDPPWKYDFAETENRKVENQYPTMTVDEICGIDLPDIADDSLLLLWATAPKLPEALKVIRAWGFTYKTHCIWDKEKIGMGYWFRGQHELLMVATRGHFSPPDVGDRQSSIYREVRGEHSAKPTYFYEWIEKSFGDRRRIELFSRNARDGWSSWGNE